MKLVMENIFSGEKNISKFLSKWNENELHNGIQNALKLQVDEIRYNKT